MMTQNIKCAICNVTDKLTDTPVQNEQTGDTMHLWLCPDHLNELERYTAGEDIDWEDWK